jgi:hypothetical protein
VSAGARSKTANDAWLVFEDTYETITQGQNGADIYERADDLWLLVDRAGNVAGKRIELRRSAAKRGSDDGWQPREYVSSSSGAYLLFIDAGALHAFDVDAGKDRALTSDFTMLSVGRVLRHSAP